MIPFPEYFKLETFRRNLVSSFVLLELEDINEGTKVKNKRKRKSNSGFKVNLRKQNKK